MSVELVYRAAESREVWEHVEITIAEIIEEGDRYLVIGDARSRARGSGIEGLTLFRN